MAEASVLLNELGTEARVIAGGTDVLADLNQLRFDQQQDPEITSRIAAYELAFRMQTSVPELVDVGDEPQHILDLYGCKPGDGSFAFGRHIEAIQSDREPASASQRAQHCPCAAVSLRATGQRSRVRQIHRCVR